MDKSVKILKEKWHVFVLILLVILLSYPAMFMDMAKGHDLEFHLQRIEGILTDISRSNFPVRLQSKWVDGYGCPISIFYGDILLYVDVVFRKLGFSIMAAYRLFLVCINAATTAISYFSFKTYFKERTVSVITTVLYCTAAYRLVDLYVRAALGETLSITFFPAVAACIYVILSDDERKNRRRAALLLSLSVSAIICTHVLTTSMLLVVLVPTCIVALLAFVSRKDRLRRLGELMFSGLTAVLISAFYVVPFLDFYLFGDIAYPESHNIQGEGLTLKDYFDFFRSPFSGVTDVQKTPGIVLMLIFIAGLGYFILVIAKKRCPEYRGRIIFEAVASFVILFMTSHVFPWNYIEKNVPLGGILTSIEFPMRYLTFAILFMTLFAGDILLCLSAQGADEKVFSSASKCIITAVLALCVFNVVNYCVYDHGYEKKANFESEESLGRWVYYSMDYQLTGTGIEKEMPVDIVTEGLLSFEFISRQSNDVMMACVSGPEYGWIQLPMFNYKYYHAEDVKDPSLKFELHDGSNRTIGILLPGGYSGICHVYWKEPFFWRIAELVSVISFLSVLVALFYDKIGFSICHFGKHRKSDAV